MLKRPNRPRESVEKRGGEGSEKVRRVTERRRDELGETREGMSPGVLVSRDFRTVNRHFSSAFENGLKRSTTVSEYCQRIADRARSSEDLAVKKMLFMTVLCLCPEVRKYYEENCPPEKFRPWFAALPGHIDDFVNGRKRDGVSRCTRPSDAKYRSVSAFVAAMTASYVGF